MYKKSVQCTLCVEFQQVQYIHLSELIDILVSPLCLVNTFCGQSRFDCLLGVPWREVKPGFQDPEKVSLQWR